jgi:hypothetical protein
VGENAPIGGISQSASYSLQPALRLDDFGSPTVAWADGSGANFSILVKTFSPNAPGIATGVGTSNPGFTMTLRQTTTDPRLGAASDIPTAGFSTGATVFLSSRMFSETLQPPGTTLRLEFEVQPDTAAFTNSPTHQALFVVPDSPTATPANIAALKFDGLPNFNYHWQARTVDQIGRSSPWIPSPTVSGTSFRINVNAPPGVSPSGGPPNSNPIATSSRSKGSCGLTGLEGVALLALLRLIRRRRAT